MKPLLALLPLLCVVLAGGTTPWSQAVMLALVGGVLLVAPPRLSLGWRLNSVLLALWLLSLTAFLPARPFGIPAWRAALTDDFQTPLPGTLSVQPWLSVDEIVVFALGLGWLYLMATLDWRVEERLRAARIYAGGVAVLAAVFVACNRLHLNPSFWHATRDFGPFPNRNQTANFLSVGALISLACARVAWRAGRFPAMGGWLLAWLVTATGVFNNYSRAGVGILFAGTAAFLGYETLRRGASGNGGRARALSVAVSLVLLLTSAFFILGGDTLTRVRTEVAGAGMETVTSEFRLRIQRDALDLIAASPWCGVGLGNFSPVFADFRTRSAVPARAVHPESDWLWMVGEMGWLALALVLAGLALLALRVWPPRHGIDRPLRAAAALGLVLFTLHSFADVSAHRLGTWMAAGLLLALTLPARAEREPGLLPARWPAALFRVLGLAFVALGVCWGQASRGQWEIPGAARAEFLTHLTRARATVGDLADAERSATETLALTPLDWAMYFLRGSIRVYRHDDAGAQEDFRRARYLEPLYGLVPFTEAKLWASFGQPDAAANALLEACRREPANVSGYVSGVYEAAGPVSLLRQRFAVAARRDPALEIEVLLQYQPPESETVIAEAVRANPELSGYTDRQKERFLEVWARFGDPETLAAAVGARPAWQTLGWRQWAEAERRMEHLPEACGIMAKSAPRPGLPPEAAGGGAATRVELEAAVAANPASPLPALRLFRLRKTDGDLPGALAALRPVADRADAPAYFHYLRAVAAGEAGLWPEAWEAWVRYDEKTAGRGGNDEGAEVPAARYSMRNDGVGCALDSRREAAVVLAGPPCRLRTDEGTPLCRLVEGVMFFPAAEAQLRGQVRSQVQLGNDAERCGRKSPQLTCKVV